MSVQTESLIFDGSRVSGGVQGNTAKIESTLNWSYNSQQYQLEKIELRFVASREQVDVHTQYKDSNGMSHDIKKIGPYDPGETANTTRYLSLWERSVQEQDYPIGNATYGTISAKFKQSPIYAQAAWTNYSDIALVLTVSLLNQVGPSDATISIVNVGTAQLATLTNNNPDVYHKVQFKYNGGLISSNEISLAASVRSVSWAVPPESVSALCATTQTTVITGALTVKTYYDDPNTPIDTRDHVCYLTIPEDANTKPTINSVKRVNASGNPESGDILQGETGLRFKITANGNAGANLASYSITTPDYSASTSWTSGASYMISAPFTPRTYTSSYVVTVVVTDSRGFTNSTLLTLDVLRCQIPRFSLAKAYRCRAANDGTADDEGEYIRVEATATAYIDSQQENITYTAKIYSPGEEEYAVASTKQGDPWIITNSARYNNKFAIDKSYVVELKAEADNLTTTTTVTLYVNTSTYTIYRLAGGQGVAFGKIAEQYGVEVTEDWPLYTHGKEIYELLVDVAHPVGQVIESVDAQFDPNASWPWTHWNKLEDVFLKGATNNGVLETGGAENTTVAINISGTTSIEIKPENLPAYSVLAAKTNAGDTGYDVNDLPNNFPSYNARSHGNVPGYKYLATTDAAQPIPISFSGSSGSQQTISTVPPYLTVNMWVRVQ